MNVYPAFRFPFAIVLALTIGVAARQLQVGLIVVEIVEILVFSVAWQLLVVYMVEGMFSHMKRRAAAATCVIVGAVLAAATIWEVSDMVSKTATDDAFFWALFRAGLGSALFVGAVCGRHDLRLRRLV